MIRVLIDPLNDTSFLKQVLWYKFTSKHNQIGTGLYPSRPHMIKQGSFYKVAIL